MKIDLTYPITKEVLGITQTNLSKSFSGHFGTHFDVMNKQFPLEYTQRQAIVFDISKFDIEHEIQLEDIDLSCIQKDMFVIFYSGFINKYEYGTTQYFKGHPQLSFELINTLINKHISLIGIDFAGVRRGKDHVPCDQLCAEHNIFIIENLYNLNELLSITNQCMMNIYPLNLIGFSGLPCRVIAQIN